MVLIDLSLLEGDFQGPDTKKMWILEVLYDEPINGMATRQGNPIQTLRDSRLFLYAFDMMVGSYF